MTLSNLLRFGAPFCLVAAVAAFAVLLLASGANSSTVLNSTAPLSLCRESLQQRIDASSPGDRLDLTGCVYHDGAVIDRPLTLVGAVLDLSTRSRPATSYNLSIEADNVTIQGWTFVDGGVAIGVFGQRNITITSSSFSRLLGSAIAIWSTDRASEGVLIEDNKIEQTRGRQVSPITARGGDDCASFNRDLRILGNEIDQGNEHVGWFGIELYCQDGVVIEGNQLSGGHTLVSLPHSRNVRIADNDFDLRGSPFWAIEVPRAEDVTIDGNTVRGDGPDGKDVFVSMNTNSLRLSVTGNQVTAVRAVIDLGGNQITVKDNCLDRVLRLTEFEDSAGPDLTLTNNGAC